MTICDRPGFEFDKAAIKYLDKCTQAVRTRLLAGIYMIPAGDIIKLVGRDGFRLRIGDYRIIFHDESRIIQQNTPQHSDEYSSNAPISYDIVHVIETIGARGDVYK